MMMKILLSLFFTIYFLSGFPQIERKENGNIITEGIPEVADSLAEKIDQYQNARAAVCYGWKTDGQGLYILTRFAESAQIHYVKQAEGARTQLSFFKEPVKDIQVSPNKVQQGFTFRKDIGGNENNQIYYYDIKQGKSRLLTDGFSKNDNPVWNSKGTKFAFISNKRNKKDFDICVSGINKEENPQMLRQSEGYWYIMDWSEDEQYLCLLNYLSSEQSYMYRYNISTQELMPINLSNERFSSGNLSAYFSTDGKGLFYSSNQSSEYLYLRYYDFTTKKDSILSRSITWDVSHLFISYDRKNIAFAVNENGLHQFYFLNPQNLTYKKAEHIPPGGIHSACFSPDGTQLAISYNSPSQGKDVYVYDIQKRELLRWTYSELGEGISASNTVIAGSFYYPTFDSVNGQRRQIPALIYKPTNKKGPFPVIISIHGGPAGQSSPAFSASMQYVVNELGIVVIYPNVRGSTGYGKTFQALDNGYNRLNAVRDIGALIDWIGSQADLNSDRIMVSGGSYGGYMVLASMVEYSDKLRAGAAQYGISNFITYMAKTESYRVNLRREEYGDERDSSMNKFLREISPIHHVDKISKPLFIAQGANDPRVPADEAEQMVKALRDKGDEVWYLLFKDEGHGFAKKTNSNYFYQVWIMFIKKYLLE
jgi:dipeptidyl aminopeptidase/acylaminoacyl peptidase